MVLAKFGNNANDTRSRGDCAKGQAGSEGSNPAVPGHEGTLLRPTSRFNGAPLLRASVWMQ